MNDNSTLPGLRLVRECLGYTQAKLGSVTGITGETICNIEQGTRGASVKTLRRLAVSLVCKPEDLLSCPTPERLKEIEIAHKRRELEQLEASRGVA